MLTFMKKFLNNKDKQPNATSRPNSLPTTSQRSSEKCYAMDSVILSKNQNEMPQFFSKHSSMFCEETKTLTNSNILQSTSIFPTRTSIQGSDESSKENRQGRMMSNNRGSVRVFGASCHDTGSSFLESQVTKVAKSPDVCCCALCNKARKECKKGTNGENARSKIPPEGKESEGRTLREIYFEDNDCIVDENNHHDPDDSFGCESSEIKINSFWPEALQQCQTEENYDLSHRPSFSTSISTKSFESFSKISMESLSSQSMVHTKIVNSTSDALQTQKLSKQKFDVDNNWPPANHSPLSLQDGEEGFKRYQFGLEWLHSQTSLSFIKPPNVTIKHVE